MKILYAVRLFSGLESSVLAKRWQPTGVPTIYRILESLDAEAAAPVLVLTAKDGHTAYVADRDVTLALDGLRHPVRVLAGARQFGWAPGRLRGALREVVQAWKLLQLWRSERPDIIYLDHANVWTAGVLARLARGRVVFRVMGVYPAMREALTGSRLAHRLLRWCYRAPYACVLCSQDGSGIEPWLEQALDPDVPRYELINGCDLPPPLPEENIDPRLIALPANRTIVLWVGKLETAKGIEAFVEGFLRSLSLSPGLLHALIVGTGSRVDWLRARLLAAGAQDHATLIERLPHAQVLEAQRRAHVYVSLNRLGNLSNANLEAMRGGQCMIFPQAQPAIGVDVATDRLVPADAAVRIATADDVEGLAAALLHLASDGAARERLAAAVRTAAARFLPSWQARIDFELTVLRAVAGGGALPPAP